MCTAATHRCLLVSMSWTTAGAVRTSLGSSADRGPCLRSDHRSDLKTDSKHSNLAIHKYESTSSVLKLSKLIYNL